MSGRGTERVGVYVSIGGNLKENESGRASGKMGESSLLDERVTDILLSNCAL